MDRLKCDTLYNTNLSVTRVTNEKENSVSLKNSYEIIQTSNKFDSNNHLEHSSISSPDRL